MTARQLKITYVPLEDLIPYAKNAKVHSEEQINQICLSIIEFGFNDPIARDGANGVIEGHGRILAAEKLVASGYKEHKVVPTIELGHLSDRQKKAYIIAHNRIAQNSTWDFKILSEELDEITKADFDITLTGLDEQEIDSLLKSDADIIPGLSNIQDKPKKEKIAKKKEASKIVHTCPHCNGTFTA